MIKRRPETRYRKHTAWRGLLQLDVYAILYAILLFKLVRFTSGWWRSPRVLQINPRHHPRKHKHGGDSCKKTNTWRTSSVFDMIDFTLAGKLDTINMRVAVKSKLKQDNRMLKMIFFALIVDLPCYFERCIVTVLCLGFPNLFGKFIPLPPFQGHSIHFNA